MVLRFPHWESGVGVRWEHGSGLTCLGCDAVGLRGPDSQRWEEKPRTLASIGDQGSPVILDFPPGPLTGRWRC